MTTSPVTTKHLILASSGRPFTDRDAAELKLKRLRLELGDAFSLEIVAYGTDGFAVAQVEQAVNFAPTIGDAAAGVSNVAAVREPPSLASLYEGPAGNKATVGQKGQLEKESDVVAPDANDTLRTITLNPAIYAFPI